MSSSATANPSACQDCASLSRAELRSPQTSGVLTVMALMQPAPTETLPTIRVKETDKIETVAPIIGDGDATVRRISRAGLQPLADENLSVVLRQRSHPATG